MIDIDSGQENLITQELFPLAVSGQAPIDKLISKLGDVIKEFDIGNYVQKQNQDETNNVLSGVDEQEELMQESQR